MPKESHIEVKVGVFVLLGFIVLTVLIFSISDFSLFEKGREIKAVFGFANGLKKSAPVRLAGVDVGTVKDIRIFFDASDKKTKADILLWLRKGTQVPVDSKVWINQLGLLGEKYIEIIPGTNTQQFIADGETVVGEDPISMEQISAMISTIAKKLEVSIDGFNEVVTSEKNKKSLEETLAGLNMIVGNIREGKGTVGRLLTDDSIFEDLQSFTADLKLNPWKLLYRPPLRKINP